MNDNLYGKIVSSLAPPITYDTRFKVTWVLLFVLDFNLLSCKLDNLKFETILKQNKFTILSWFLVENLK